MRAFTIDILVAPPLELVVAKVQDARCEKLFLVCPSVREKRKYTLVCAFGLFCVKAFLVAPMLQLRSDMYVVGWHTCAIHSQVILRGVCGYSAVRVHRCCGESEVRVLIYRSHLGVFLLPVVSAILDDAQSVNSDVLYFKLLDKGNCFFGIFW